MTQTHSVFFFFFGITIVYYLVYKNEVHSKLILLGRELTTKMKQKLHLQTITTTENSQKQQTKVF